MKLNDEYSVEIEKMINEGQAIARVENFPVFIKNACPKDIVKIKINKINKNYAEGEIMEITKPSVYRKEPICKLHKICGSCNWLYMDYNEQLLQKQNIVKETLKNIAGVDFEIKDIIPSPQTTQYRCKVQYPIAQKQSGRIIAGYYKNNTHEIINIKYCPIHSSLISDILEFIKDEAQKLNISGYDETAHKGLLRHVVFRQSSFDGKILIVFVLNSEKIAGNIKKLADILTDKYENITGICANFNNKKTNVIFGRETQVIKGNSYYMEKLSDITYKISADSFFQVNPKCSEIIFNTVKELISERLTKPSILDAYSGVSTFGIWLSSIAEKAVCVEESQSASNDAKDNIILNNCKNIQIINGNADKKFSDLINKSETFDVSIIDPPRKGSSEIALNNLIKLTKSYIVYVSCNVSTLARDMKFLMNNGFSPEYIQPVDMFPNTYHVETIVLFKKQ